MKNLTKNTYLKKITKDCISLQKREVRDFIFSKFRCSNIVGLAGPCIDEYIDWCKTMKFKNIEIYENNNEVFLHQFSGIKEVFKLKFGDINEEDFDKEDTLYDLDYCCTIKKIRDYIPKYEKNYCITLSTRSVGADNTLDEFLKTKDEEIFRCYINQYPVKHTDIETVKGGIYIYAPYCDSSPMCCIAKIN